MSGISKWPIVNIYIDGGDIILPQGRLILDPLEELSDLGSLWNSTKISAHRECLDILERVRPGRVLRWAKPTPDDVSRMPTNIDATLVGEESNPTTALDSVPEWLQWVQAPDTLSAAEAAGVHSWGLMLPTSARTPGVNYKLSGCKIPSSEQTSGRLLDCWYPLFRRP